MQKEFKNFTKEDCKAVLASIVNNKNHVNNKKTLTFLIGLQKIDNNNIDKIIKCSEEYYYFISSYLNLTEKEKLFFVVDQVKSFSKSKHQCCLNVLDPTNQKNIIDHILSVDHFLCLYNYDYNYLSNIKFISDYFIVTGNINSKELILIHSLLNENNLFLPLIQNNYTKLNT